MELIIFSLEVKCKITTGTALGPSEESPPQTDQVNNLPPRLKQLKIVQNW